MSSLKISVNDNVRRDQDGNLFSSCHLDDSQLCKIADECWHLQQPYYRDGYVRVPIPATLNARSTFYCNIVKMTDKLSISSQVFFHERTNRFVLRTFAIAPFNAVAAKFVDLIIGSKTALARDRYQTSGKEWEIVNYRATLDKDVPAQFHEIAHDLNTVTTEGTMLCRYCIEDLQKSVMFWSEHCFAQKPLT